MGNRSRNDQIHRNVVRISGELVDDLLMKSDAHSQGLRPGEREGSVIESFSAPQSHAAAVETETGAKEDVDIGYRNNGEPGFGLRDSECAGSELLGSIDLVEDKIAVDYPGKGPAVVGESGDQIKDRWFTRERGIAGDAAWWPLFKVPADAPADGSRLLVGIGDGCENRPEPFPPLGLV